MTAKPEKAPKKEKAKKQTPEQRLEAMRYNRMMYGPTAKEMKPAVKKVNYGAIYLNHPKFQSLMTAFKKGAAFKFEVTDKAKTHIIATDGSDISFNGKTIFYSRPMNRYEDHLLLDRVSMTQYQTTDALIHLAFAVLRSIPELAGHSLVYMQHQFYYGAEPLEDGITERGPNLLIGSYRHSKAQEKARNQ
jgi:hypothetical protein